MSRLDRCQFGFGVFRVPCASWTFPDQQTGASLGLGGEAFSSVQGAVKRCLALRGLEGPWALGWSGAIGRSWQAGVAGQFVSAAENAGVQR